MRYSYYYSNQKKQRVRIQDIDEKQYERLLSSIKKINTVVFQLDYYLMVYLNFIDFLELYKTCGYFDELSFVKYNCSYNNFLNSYYIMWEFIKYNNFCEGKIKEYAEKIKRDETCICALAFRNYGVHNSQIIKKQEIDILNNTKKILIDLDGITSDKDTKKSEIEIIQKYSLLDSREFAIELINKVKSIIIELMEIEKKDIEDSVKYVLSFLPLTRVDRYNTLIQLDEQENVLQIGRVIKQYDDRMKLFNMINEKIANNEYAEH